MDTNVTYMNADALNDELRSVLLPVTIYVGLEAVLGFFGNMVVLLVFTFRYHSCNFRYFVLCLALTDVIACCTAISGEVVTQTYWYIYPVPQICKTKSFFNVFTVFAEAFCLLTIAIDRYRKVCVPLGRQITPKVARVICVVIYILSGIIAIPVAIFWGTHDRVISRTGITVQGVYYTEIRTNVTVCEIDQNYLGTADPKIYTYSLETIVSTSLAPMFILYILIARTLVGSSTPFRKPTSQDNKRDNNSNPNSQIKNIDSQVISNKQTKRIPSKSSVSHLEDLEMESSTLNSMSTTQSIGNPLSNESNSRPAKRSIKKKNSKLISTRVRRKTLIMFILTLVFIITTITYLTMLGLIAGDILETLSDSGKAAYFFFFRFYFINHVINPIVYGLLDPQFRKVMQDVYKKTMGMCF